MKWIKRVILFFSRRKIDTEIIIDPKYLEGAMREMKVYRFDNPLKYNYFVEVGGDEQRILLVRVGDPYCRTILFRRNVER